MIKGDSKMSDKIVDMMSSPDAGMNMLAMEVLKKEQPAVYAALLNYSGYRELDEKAIKEIYRNKDFNIGTVVKYRGMDDCPKMVITHIEMKKLQNMSATNTKYYFNITAKWYNKSSQTFHNIQDRLECFEIIKQSV